MLLVSVWPRGATRHPPATACPVPSPTTCRRCHYCRLPPAASRLLPPASRLPPAASRLPPVFSLPLWLYLLTCVYCGPHTHAPAETMTWLWGQVRCLSFDFIGTNPDEAGEDVGTIQVPSSWRDVVAAPTTVALLISLYTATEPPVSTRAMEVRRAVVHRRPPLSRQAHHTGHHTCLGACTPGLPPLCHCPAPPPPFFFFKTSSAPHRRARARVCVGGGGAFSPGRPWRQVLVLLCSVRRSLFRTEAERGVYLGAFMGAIREILRAGLGLAHPENYHEFCRLLGRLKANYQV